MILFFLYRYDSFNFFFFFFLLNTSCVSAVDYNFNFGFEIIGKDYIYIYIIIMDNLEFFNESIVHCRCCRCGTTSLAGWTEERNVSGAAWRFERRYQKTNEGEL